MWSVGWALGLTPHPKGLKMAKSRKVVKPVAAVAPEAVSVPAPEAVATPVPATSGHITYYVAGKAASHHNTESPAHKRQGDVAILKALVAAIAEKKAITQDEAINIIVAINPKNKAFLRYASVSRGWLVKKSTETEPMPK